ncbi:MAG: hypothetical protein AAGI48_13385 [Verrucomicrobiota bacterium]
MKTLPVIVASFIASSYVSEGGRPIILSESDACSRSELVVIANVGEPKDIPEDELFGGSKWDEFGFTRFAESKIKKTLIGKGPENLQVYGGKINAGTHYRLEAGYFLLLLSKVGDGAGSYRAVDWHYSFMPIKDGKVSWLVDRFSKKRE